MYYLNEYDNVSTHIFVFIFIKVQAYHPQSQKNLKIQKGYDKNKKGYIIEQLKKKN